MVSLCPIKDRSFKVSLIPLDCVSCSKAAVNGMEAMMAPTRIDACGSSSSAISPESVFVGVSSFDSGVVSTSG